MATTEQVKKPTGPRRTHTLGACQTCRRRHVKCDQTHPACKTCKSAKVQCDGYTSELRWMSSPSKSPCRDSLGTRTAGPNVRQHLYTEKARAKMSSALVHGLADSTINDSLEELDACSRDIQSQYQGEMAVGPFGVLNLSSKPDSPVSVPASTAPPPYMQVMDCDAHMQMEEQPVLTDLLSNPVDISPGLDFFSDQGYLEWADIFDLDPLPLGLPVSMGEQELGLESIFCPQEQLLSQQTASIDLLSEAPMLLRHFKDHLIPQIIWLPTTKKSLWTIMFLPTASYTLSELTYLSQGTIEQARLTNLYAILACSAYHLSVNPRYKTAYSVEQWQTLASATYSTAQKALRLTLELEFQGPGKAKYKDQLMALLSMTTFAILCEKQTDTRSLFLATESLIRLRGLVKPYISRRARLLHHMYTWIRILTESTFLLHDEITQPPTFNFPLPTPTPVSILQASLSSTNPLPPSIQVDTFLRIEPTKSRNDNDLNIDELKDAKAGLDDIHLEDSRTFKGTMHMQINGVSETWLSLLSQTMRLANVLDRVHAGQQQQQQQQVQPETLAGLQRRAAHLEDMICSFTSRDQPQALHNNNNNNNEHNRLQQPMVRALNSALVLYFYRRVRSVNSCILQGYVTQIIDAITDFESALAQHGLDDGGPGTGWPVFLAGCEAIGAERREFLLNWMERAGAKCGIPAYARARDIMVEVWRRRAGGSGSGSGNSSGAQRQTRSQSKARGSVAGSWMDISKEEGWWLLLA